MNIIEELPICGCGITNKGEHLFRHVFKPISVLTRLEKKDNVDAKEYFMIDAKDWPAKKIISRCSFLDCHRTIDQHGTCGHAWQGYSFEKRIIFVELPSDAKCDSCGIVASDHNFRHHFASKIIIENKGDYDDIHFLLDGGRTVDIV